MEYVKFYGLDDEPFRNDPDRRFYFEGHAPTEARMRLLRGVRQRKGLSVLVGGPGCGKTTLARHLLDQLDGKERAVRLLAIPHAACDAGWLLPRIASAFGVAQPAGTPMQLLGQIFERLATLKAAGTHAVLLVDEAQMLQNREVMEECRGLLNLEHNGVKLLSMVLFGLPELSDVLRLDAPLAQRIDIRVRLGVFDEADTAEYVKHRLSCVGGAPSLFDEEAISVLHACTGGTPRLINTVADNALFEGFLRKAERISAELVRTAAEELDLVPCQAEPEPLEEPEAQTTLVSPFALGSSQPTTEPSAHAAGWGSSTPQSAGPAAPQVQPPPAPAPELVDPPVPPLPKRAATPEPERMPEPERVPDPEQKRQVAPRLEPTPQPAAAAPAAADERAASERVGGSWESPIEDETEDDMRFDGSIEVELDEPFEEEQELAFEELVDEDSDETSRTLSGLVNEMDADWDSNVKSRKAAAAEPKGAAASPDEDAEGESENGLVDALFDQIQVED